MNDSAVNDRVATTRRATGEDLAGGHWRAMPRAPQVALPIHRPALGLLELSTEVVMAKELLAFLPTTAGLYTGRMEFGGDASIAGLSAVSTAIPSATALLPEADWMHAIIYGCTSGTIVLGEPTVARLIHTSRPGVSVVTPIGAVLKALAALQVRKIAVVTPYVQEVNMAVAGVLTSAGIEIVSARTLDQLSGEEMFRTPSSTFMEAALEADCPEAEAIFISCTGIIVSPFLYELEQRLGKPVISSNQAIAWQCREIAGVGSDTGIHGALFARRLP